MNTLVPTQSYLKYMNSTLPPFPFPSSGSTEKYAFPFRKSARSCVDHQRILYEKRIAIAFIVSIAVITTRMNLSANGIHYIPNFFNLNSLKIKSSKPMLHTRLFHDHHLYTMEYRVCHRVCSHLHNDPHRIHRQQHNSALLKYCSQTGVEEVRDRIYPVNRIEISCQWHDGSSLYSEIVLRNYGSQNHGAGRPE